MVGAASGDEVVSGRTPRLAWDDAPVNRCVPEFGHLRVGNASTLGEEMMSRALGVAFQPRSNGVLIGSGKQDETVRLCPADRLTPTVPVGAHSTMECCGPPAVSDAQSRSR